MRNVNVSGKNFCSIILYRFFRKCSPLPFTGRDSPHLCTRPYRPYWLLKRICMTNSGGHIFCACVFLLFFFIFRGGGGDDDVSARHPRAHTIKKKNEKKEEIIYGSPTAAATGRLNTRVVFTVVTNVQVSLTWSPPPPPVDKHTRAQNRRHPRVYHNASLGLPPRKR